MTRERCFVHYVIDGDTFDCRLKNGREVRVRLLGIDTLEVKHGRKGRDECHGPAAERAMAALVRNKWVTLRSSTKARSGSRLARFVFVKRNGRWLDVGKTLLALGHAVQFTRVAESALAKSYNRVAAYARRRGRRIWDTNSCGKGPAAQLRLKVNYAEKRGSLNTEFVEIRNVGTNTVNLKGWILRTMLHVHFYRFKRNTYLRPGSTLLLHTGKGQDRAGHSYWGRNKQVWLHPRPNGYGNAAYLIDPEENFRFWSVYHG